MNHEIQLDIQTPSVDVQYAQVVRKVLNHGTLRGNRTGTRAVSTFGNFMDLDISDNIALLTTKKLPLRYIVGELLWFIAGSSDIALLNEISGVPKDKDGIWDEWALSKNYYQEVVRDVSEMVTEIAVRDGRKEMVINQELVMYQQKYGLDGITKYMSEHGVEVRKKVQVGHKGYIGPLYGHQWRRKQTESYIDQFENLLQRLERDPLDRRHLLVAWDPDALPRADLTMDENILIGRQPIAPCHWASQYYIEPELTTENSPVIKLTTDEEGNVKYIGHTHFLGEYFKVLNAETNEFIGTYVTADHRVSKVVSETNQIDVIVPPAGLEHGIILTELGVDLVGLSPNTEYQFFTSAGHAITTVDGKASGMLHMRSSDVFLGLPFNIPSYALLIKFIARELGATTSRLCVTLGDYHIYENHLEQIQEQLTREPLPQHTFEWDPEVPSLRQIMQMGNSPISLKAAVDAVVRSIKNYESHARISGDVAV